MVRWKEPNDLSKDSTHSEEQTQQDEEPDRANAEKQLNEQRQQNYQNGTGNKKAQTSYEELTHSCPAT